MKCPKCGSDDDKVLDSRTVREGAAIRRRRECAACGFRFTTHEEIDRDEVTVVKRDGTREPFSRAKVEKGVRVACQKRDVLTVHLMIRGLAAAEIVVVHAGQIVVNERVGVDHFDRAGKRCRRVVAASAESRKLKHKLRTYALAACLEAVFHRFDQHPFTAIEAGQTIEQRLLCQFGVVGFHFSSSFPSITLLWISMICPL